MRESCRNLANAFHIISQSPSNVLIELAAAALRRHIRCCSSISAQNPYKRLNWVYNYLYILVQNQNSYGVNTYIT